MGSPIIKTLYVTDNTFVNDDIRFVINPSLIDPRLIDEYLVSQSLVKGTEFEFDVNSKNARVYMDTVFAPVTQSQNYVVVVTTPLANRQVFEQQFDKQFRELDQDIAFFNNDEFQPEFAE